MEITLQAFPLQDSEINRTVFTFSYDGGDFMINQQLQLVENTHKVKIIFACEAGSRATGLDTENSDYDVRFLYIRPIEWYLSIDKKNDVISLPINDSLDLHGWDLQKALILLKKSNPTLLEWLHSPMIYQKNDQIIQNIIETIPSMFSAKTCVYHYLHMAQRNYQEVLKKPTVKLYLNVIRPLLACSWIERYNTFPPNEFQQLVIGSDAEWAIIELVKVKKGQKGTPNYLVLNTYIETELSRFSHIANNLDGRNEKSTKQLDEIFLFALQEVWRINLHLGVE